MATDGSRAATSMDRDTRRMARDRGPALGVRLRGAVRARLTPEYTRRATGFERLTVTRLRWEQLVRLNRWLELLGKIATGLWVAFIASLAFGLDWRDVVEEAVNSGKPVEGALALAIVGPTLLFVAARSLIGFARWRLQRELWRRDVERLDGSSGTACASRLERAPIAVPGPA